MISEQTPAPRRIRSERIQIPDTGLRGRDGDPYVADSGLLDAADVALTLQRPLLLTGDPGCGKTDFAYAAANALTGGHLLECQIRSDVRARDLLYHYDPILRFTEGHHGTKDDRKRARDPRNYVQLRPLGVALMSPTLRVVLIDEIDKAPRDLPNDLLRELDSGTFEIPEIRDPKPGAAQSDDVLDPETEQALRRVMRRPKPEIKPFVIITSNVERQLPDAFLRRCVFFHIEFPEGERLRDILRAHFSGENTAGGSASGSLPAPRLDDIAITRIAALFTAARKIPNLTKKPSTAELLDWVRALELLDPAHVSERLSALHGALQGQSGSKPKDSGLRWSSLPAITCLFKLHADIERAADAPVIP